MKKNIFLSIIAMALLFSAVAFASETDAEKSTDETLAALNPEKSSVAAESMAADQDAFKEDELIVNEAKSSPIATVSSASKTETSASPATEEAAPEEIAGAEASSAVPRNKIDSEAKAEPRTSSALNAAEMQRRWKALFSKEITPDSMAYTVKPGDSLYVLARKNHTTVDFIKKINGLKSDDIYPKMKLKIHTKPFSIAVDKSKNTLVLYSEDVPVKKYSVATGKKNCTPVGTFKIKDKLVNPTWFKTGAILPPGSPKNALGTRWMGFDKPAYGIHGTIEPKTIGTQASEGCIRMLNEDVEELYSIVPVNTKVTIQD